MHFQLKIGKDQKKKLIFYLDLLEDFLSTKLKNLHKNGIKFKIIGNKNNFSKKLKKLLRYAEQLTNYNNKDIIATKFSNLNYGSKSEILNSIKLIKRNKKEINEKNIDTYLYTSGIPDPEILIRTGNTNRLSNFLLWQLCICRNFFY